MKDYSKTAALIVQKLGTHDNIMNVTHCMTRLRFTLKTDSAIKDDEIKNIPNVIGVVRKGGQYQVIIGNDVDVCFNEVQKLMQDDIVTSNNGNKKFTFKGWGASMLDAISGSIAPIIPVILGCGMVKIILIMLDLIGGFADYPTYKLLIVIGDVGYYFLPILLAYSASKKFRCNTPLAMTLVAILVHPDLIAILSQGNTSFLNIPVTAANYSSSVIPALLSVWLLAKIEPLADRIFTGWRRTLLKPLAILLIGTPIILIVLAPLGMLIGNGMAYVLNFMYAKVGWLTIGLYSALLPFVVMAGMHVAMFPYIFGNLNTFGYDFLQLPAMLAYNFSQAAAAAAVAIKAKDKDLKATATAAAISACVGGITEPALYGINLRLKKPLIASMIGSGISGLLIGFLGIKAFAFSGPCLLSFPMFASNEFTQNFVFAILATVVSIIVTFCLTLLFGWEEDENTTDVKKKDTTMEVASPLCGEVMPLAQVNDETFAKEMIGKGVAIVPKEGKVIAPFDGRVIALFPTLHAIGLENTDGSVEVLIHIGIDTVALAGKGYNAFVKVEDEFTKGDILLAFDIEAIKAAGYDVTTPVIVSNSLTYDTVAIVADTMVHSLEPLLSLYKKG